MFFDSSYPLEGLNESLSFLISIHVHCVGYIPSHLHYRHYLQCACLKIVLVLCLLNDLMIEDHMTKYLFIQTVFIIHHLKLQAFLLLQVVKMELLLESWFKMQQEDSLRMGYGSGH